MTATWRNRLILAAPLFGVVVAALFVPTDDGPTICPFALCTGTACPGCGMTRAASNLIRGDLGTAITYHPLVLLIAIQAMAGWIWFMLRRAGRVQPMPQRTLNLIMGATAAALLLVWVMRLVSGTLPPV